MDGRRTWTRLLPVCFLALTCPLPCIRAATKPADERAVAQRVDAALLKAAGKDAALPQAADDETFLRRASFDLTGKLPTPDELRAFVVDTDPGKRARLIDRLLASDAYSVNWGRYWRDVLTYYTPASGNYLRWELFDRWMVEQVRRNRPWSELVSALVTADGINDECAPVNFLTSHFGNPVEIAATTSRVFLGIQLQCAQCHDARTEPYKREQFHQFVAFFGRARLVQHKDVNGRGTPYAIEGQDNGQYCMTDKKDTSHLIAMAPRFFLTGEAIAADAPDAERRAALARFLTSPKNPYFARAYVNRVWTCLMGWGFYPGLADLGEDGVSPQYPELLDLLAAEWTASGYDMRWLFRTLANTQAYQRHLQPRPGTGMPGPAAVCPERLRAEQVFEALARALGCDENDKTIPAPAPSTAPAVARHTGLRHMVYQAFKVDPSLPQDEVQGTIPQALLLMNSELVNRFTAATGKTFLTEALGKSMTDEAIITVLYERTLARRPKEEELEACRRYVQKVGDRREALEDVFWCLVNSTEFLTKP
jgi:hypothetical protein